MSAAALAGRNGTTAGGAGCRCADGRGERSGGVADDALLSDGSGRYLGGGKHGWLWEGVRGTT